MPPRQFAKIKDHPAHLASVTVTRPLLWTFRLT
jgi:hypothetical protein